MDALNDPAVHTIVLMWPAQSGKSEVILNILGYFIDQDPSPMLMVQPTLEMGEAFSKDRIAPMLRDTPALKGKVREVRAKGSENTIRHKKFPGGHITICGANSPASLAMRPVRVVLCDEVDRYPLSAGSEGDPVKLAQKRADTFFNRKFVLTSTPTIKGASRIEMAWEESDRRQYLVPCPHCGEYQPLTWARVKWDKAKPETARIECVECDGAITDAHKPAMLRKGRWEADGDFGGVAGFHLNALYSPWVEMSRLAEGFLRAKKGGPELLKVWINTALAETWEDQGTTVDDSALLARREKYRAEVPAGGLLLTAGVDIQDDRLEVGIYAWGSGEEGWLVDRRVIYGDPGRADVWQELDDVLANNYGSEAGGNLRIAAAAIDSGHMTKEVYAYVGPRQARHVWAVKGIGGQGRRAIPKATKQKSGRQRKPILLYSLGVDEIKGTIYSRLQITERGPGFWHFPIETWCDEEFFAQLTAEKRVTKMVRGYPKREWIKTRQRNEQLDIAVYALAALWILNPVWKSLTRRAEKVAEEEGKEPEKKLRKRKGSSYVNRYRRR